jgi:AhpD family alkylhydroperoxidase
MEGHVPFLPATERNWNALTPGHPVSTKIGPPSEQEMIMSRLYTSPSIEAAPAASQPLLQTVKTKLGSVPNLFRVVASSPAALEGYLGLSGALSKGLLSAQTRERIALAVAEINGCGYCLAAHTYIARNAAKLDDAEITANRNGASNDPKADA